MSGARGVCRPGSHCESAEAGGVRVCVRDSASSRLHLLARGAPGTSARGCGHLCLPEAARRLWVAEGGKWPGGADLGQDSTTWSVGPPPSLG